MRDDDTFRLIDRDGAVFIVCALIGIIAAFAVPRAPRDVAPERQPHCEVTVAQYGPGERWVPKPPVPACAGRMVALPDHILTSPVKESK